MMAQKRFQYGFTLIELSIVLVIIGLIVGGILVGQELIHAAEIRATISQLNKYNAAVNIFRDKYGGIPGDLDYKTACNLNFFCFSNAAAGTTGFGDGNGLIENSAGASSFASGAYTLQLLLTLVMSVAKNMFFGVTYPMQI